MDRLKALLDKDPAATVKGITDEVYSSRSFYALVAISPSPEGVETPAADVLRALKDLLGEGTMHGYKGGEFPVTADLPILVEPYGVSYGPFLCEITDDGETVAFDSNGMPF